MAPPIKMIPPQLTIFRIENPPSTLHQSCSTLCQQTKYQKFAKREKAPETTDCLTSVDYLFRDRTKLLVDYIGNMPGHLSQERTWQTHEIPPQDLQQGDLLFLKRKKSQRRITHLALALGDQKIFHCSPQKGGAIENLEQIFSIYTQAPKDQMIAYKDPRGSLTEPFHNFSQAAP